MCYYGSQYSKGFKKDQGHFNLIADLHTLIRDAQMNVFYGEAGKNKLKSHLKKLMDNVERGEYRNIKHEDDRVIDKCTPEMSVDREI